MTKTIVSGTASRVFPNSWKRIYGNIMKIFQNSLFWWFGFTLMFFLALDFRSGKQPVTLSWFNLPPWIFYFLGLQIAFAIALIIFAGQFWQTPSEEKSRK